MQPYLGGWRRWDGAHRQLVQSETSLWNRDKNRNLRESRILPQMFCVLFLRFYKLVTQWNQIGAVLEKYAKFWDMETKNAKTTLEGNPPSPRHFSLFPHAFPPKMRNVKILK